MAVVDTVLGVLGLVIFIPCVISFAAGMTWITVKIFPAPTAKAENAKS
jgi:hypothetical protein